MDIPQKKALIAQQVRHRVLLTGAGASQASSYHYSEEDDIPSSYTDQKWRWDHKKVYLKQKEEKTKGDWYEMLLKDFEFIGEEVND